MAPGGIRLNDWLLSIQVNFCSTTSMSRVFVHTEKKYANIMPREGAIDNRKHIR